MTLKKDTCPVCNSQLKKNLHTVKIKKTNQFYENYILSVYKNDIKKIKSIQCKKCFSHVNTNWFSNDKVFRIFNVVYPQHHRGWKNFYDVFKKKENKYHKIIYKIFNELKVKKYAEFNCPFSGIFLDLLKKELPTNKIKILIHNSIELLKVNQLARNKNKDNFIKAFSKFTHLFKKIENINNSKKSIIKNYFFTDNSFSSWGGGDISGGVNSKSLSNLIFNLETYNLNEIPNKNFKLDLFFFGDTLDHTSKPKKVLDFALNNSKVVLILTNSGDQVTKQHQFSFSEKFVDYLNKEYHSKKIFEDKVSNELLLIVSKKKINLNRFDIK
tara:strand:+ start:1 stop:981 length:981 start_codon:yes stop_codon:yes gene_type:complete